MTIRDRIRELANSRGMSLPDVESALGFGNGTIVKWGKASPNSDKLKAVADYFDVSLDYLVGRNESEFANLSGVYLNFAKEAQKNDIDPDDIRLALDTIKRLKDK